MRVAYIFPLFPQFSETFACLDVKKYHEINSSVTVYSLRKPNKEQVDLKSERGIEEIPLEFPSFFDNFKSLFYLPHVFFLLYVVLFNERRKVNIFKCLLYILPSVSLYRKIKAKDHDVVHLFWGHTPSVCGLLFKKFAPNIKVTLFLGAYDLEQKLGVSKLLMSMSDAVFTHSLSNVEKINEMNSYVEPVVIHRGVNTELDIYQVDTNKFYNRWCLSSRLIPTKNVDKAIILFNECSKDDLKAELWIFGDGPEINKLRSLTRRLGIEKKVTFFGHVNQYDMLKKMATCGVSLLLSTKAGECLPNSVKEAMLLGCKVIVSRTTGIEELIPNKKYGLIVDDVYNLPNNIADELTNIDTSKAIQIVKASFCARNSAYRYHEIWNSKNAR